jgi:hypothetical protein
MMIIQCDRTLVPHCSTAKVNPTFVYTYINHVYNDSWTYRLIQTEKLTRRYGGKTLTSARLQMTRRDDTMLLP